ncbi:MAG: DUF4190 domain-containing protein [Spirochaetales bacterium]|nr:DUF4190 domain-containing protein [Spirochaetales bacterium]MCF7937850.1 DUF4190 domain-containing protein [Spirochaetales bacterium]
MAVASLVLGILSILGAFTVVGSVAGLPLGILAIVFSGPGKRREPEKHGLATAGLITGIIGLVVSILIVAIFGTIIWAAFAAIESSGPEIERSLEEFFQNFGNQFAPEGKKTI